MKLKKVRNDTFMDGVWITLLTVSLPVVGSVYTLQKKMQNTNVSESRKKWLDDVKGNFYEYNATLAEIKEIINNNEQDEKEKGKEIAEKRKKLEKIKLQICLQFKPGKTQKQKSIMEYIGELSNGKKFENTNDVEKEFFVLMNQINLFLIDSSNNLERIFSLSKKENEQWNVDGMLQIFMRLVEQFQLFIAKIEWDRIKKETRVFSLPLKNKQAENLYIEILSENLKTICQPDENTEEMEKVDAKVESSNEFSEFSTILNSEFTVAKKLQLVLEELDKKYKGHLPNSVMTSTQKRYIYSTIDTIHPNGKNFFALKKYVSLINNKVYYIETNFSKEYGNLIAQRMIRQVKEYNTEKA